MSIYHARLKRLPENGSPQEAGPGGARPSATPLAQVPARPARDWSQNRRAKPADYLLPFSVSWLARLPPAVRPVAMSVKYPRIVNRLALDWNEPATCRADFEELLYDHRGKRKGFPDRIHRELLALNEHWLSLQLATDNGLALV